MTQTRVWPVALTAALLAGGAATTAAQEAETAAPADDAIEEVVVTGSHIRGASIAGALPVSVIEADAIESFGIDSGDELLQFLPEQGQNFFNDEENISGGVNSARGDIGAFNLRSLGTGNTLVLLNGRRMVNAASYQTEEVGGSFVPVNTANSNTLPVYGIERLEVLKDGASALYGADAVAGVVNTVLKTDVEGLTAKVRYGAYEHLGRNTARANLAWGRFFNDGRTNVAVLFDFFQRDRISAHEDERWADADFRRRIPADSPWAGDTRFRNTSAHSLYGQFDVTSSASRAGLRGTLTDGSGEFETYPAGHPRCQWELGYGTCGAIDGQGTLRRNVNLTRDLSSDLTRTNLFVFVNHEFANGMEGFSELQRYGSQTHMFRHASAAFSTVKLRVGRENHYNPFGPCGSPNRLPDSVIPDVPCAGLALEIDFYRYAERPRIVENDGTVWRILEGLRGSRGRMDWEAAVLWSRAEREDVTRNRVSNTLMVQALADPTPAAYNPFSGGVNSNIERALIDVYRDNEMTLALADFKLSTDELFYLPAGPVGGVAGVEYRRESFSDDRDPRLDGTIVFTDFQGDTYPYVSDVVNSSPTPDSSGSRNVASLFAELQIPVIDAIDVQAAVRYEDFSDVGDTIVGKFAVGWQVAEPLLLRASWSEAFRAPNLVTVYEDIVARQNTRTDWACFYAAQRGGDPDQDVVDCRNSTQRIAQGSNLLVPERSDNFSVGAVFGPFRGVTLTLDHWAITKDETIGLFGEENHTVLDLLLRLDHGADNCGSLRANPAVVRETEVSDDEAAVFQRAGICPAGAIRFIQDNYANLDTRELAGWDFAAYYKLETAIGDFDMRYRVAFLTKMEQAPGGPAAELVAAARAGTLPGNIPIAGFSAQAAGGEVDKNDATLLRRDGNQKDRHSLWLSWRKDSLGATLSGRRVGRFYQNSLTLADKRRWWIPAMTTWNASFDYRAEYWQRNWRLRVGVNNLFDERAPLADRFFGYFADAHRDYGRNFYLEVRTSDL